MNRLLVVAGEGSGDLLASRVVARLSVPSFGFGGPLLAAAGTELVADLRTTASMGVLGVAPRVPAMVRALTALARAVRRSPPPAALLVGLSETNARLAPLLQRRGTRVLWYAPPQVWAWRPGRAPALARACDALALVLPFETDVWARAGARATYVGHPSLETLERRLAFPRRADSPSPSPRLLILPGSRGHEVRAHTPVLLDAAARLSARGLVATLALAPSLDEKTARYVSEAAARTGVAVSREPLETAAEGATVALVASGTATLECAALGVPPVIVYRTDPVTYALARRLVRTPFIGLPNLVLGRPAFPELVQDALTAESAEAAVTDVLASLPFHRLACDEARARLSAGLDARAPSERVAAVLSGWLS